MQDRVVIKRVVAEEKTASGLFIPDSAKEKPQEGEVIAVGKGKRQNNGERIEPGVSKGDRVLFSKYAGTEIKFDGVEYLIMREDDLLGVIVK
jgi:chaperonin GroES